MKTLQTFVLALGLSAVATPAMADIDGEKVARKCSSCHTFDDGGRNLTGPNLFGIIGREAGSKDDFPRYSKSMKSLGEGGFVWTEDKIKEYVQDPTTFLRAETGDAKARGLMSFKLTKEDEIEAIAAYLATLK